VNGSGTTMASASAAMAMVRSRRPVYDRRVNTAALVEALYALGLGLVIGLEREHSVYALASRPPAEPGAPRGSASMDTSAARSDAVSEAATTAAPVTESEAAASAASGGPLTMGARTMALIGLTGWLLAFLSPGAPWLLPVGLIAVALMIGVQMIVSKDLGMTTEVAGLVVLLIGVLVRTDRGLAVALTLGTALLLVSKPWMIDFVGKLRRIEVTATLQLLLLVAIVLPLLPTEPLDPWDALAPRKVGTFIVLIAGVQYVGYVLTRWLGPTRGTGLAGLVGGLSSSTAVTVSMARAAKADPALVVPGQLATLLANTVMPIRVAVIAWTLSPAVGRHVAVALATMAATLLVAALITWRQLRAAHATGSTPIKLRNPFALWEAILWGGILCAVLLVARLAIDWFGESGLYVAAAISGLTDVDAITLAAAEEGKAGTLAAPWAALAITIAAVSNTIAKGTMAYFGGGRRFGRRIAVVFAIAIVLTIGTALVNVAR
jgi:uncharacterized membrane protein (DUF4010 family)